MVGWIHDSFQVIRSFHGEAKGTYTLTMDIRKVQFRKCSFSAVQLHFWGR